MCDYLASRIIVGAYTYAYVILKRPDLTDCVAASLTKYGRSDLIIT